MEYWGADSSCEYHGCEIFDLGGTIPEDLMYRTEGTGRLDIVFGTIAVVILVFLLAVYVYFDRSQNEEGKGAEGGCDSQSKLSMIVRGRCGHVDKHTKTDVTNELHETGKYARGGRTPPRAISVLLLI